jgi:hypothetical protein
LYFIVGEGKGRFCLLAVTLHDREETQMDDPIDKCYVCGDFFIERSLETVRIPDSGIYIQKKICKKCRSEIEARSLPANKDGGEKAKGKLLMEGNK